MRNSYTNYPPCPHGVARTRNSIDGLTSKCPDCLKERDRNRPNAAERNEKQKARVKEQMKDPVNKLKRKQARDKWIKANTIKRAAHILVGNHLRDGKIIKEPCEVCGELEVDAHHDDYEKPFEVRWLCKKHHAEHHKQEREKLRGIK